MMDSPGTSNIRDLTDFPGLVNDHAVEVEITIAVDGLHPPVGSVRSSEDSCAKQFIGWLGLLTVLSTVLDRVPAAEVETLDPGE